MIRILQSVSNMDRGGIETMLMNFYKHTDREQVQFDFLQNKAAPGAYDDEIREMGGRIFVSPGFKSPARYLSFMKELTKDHPEYKIIHAHNGSLMMYPLTTAKRCGIPVRIGHAHATAVPVGLKNQVKKVLRPKIKYVATDYWGCSEAAGEFYFSRKRWENAHELIHNAIDIPVFTFSETHRETLRREYGLGEKLIVGNVGRLAPQKNQMKLLDVFAEVHKRNSSTHLVIIGAGELEDVLKRRTAELGITDFVTFTGVLANVNEWYSVFDVFVMTSLYEGLPVVGIEAQAADLPCLFTDTITPEVQVTENVRFMGLHDSAEAWADVVLDLLTLRQRPRKSRAMDLTLAGYDINHEARRMQGLYVKLSVR